MVNPLPDDLDAMIYVCSETAWVGEQGFPEIVRAFAACVLGGLAYFSYAVTVIFVVPLMRVTAWGTPEGRFPYYSGKAFQWASYNALILLVRPQGILGRAERVG